MVETKKTRVTFSITESMGSSLNKRLVDDNYKLKDKSKWICEAIVALMERNNAVELVRFTGDMSSMDKKETVTMPIDLKEILFDFTSKVRKKYSDMGAIQGRIIRASIAQRLLRKNFSVTEKQCNPLKNKENI